MGKQNVMPKVNGKTFRCECGCNVFHEIEHRSNGDIVYGCNACQYRYIGEVSTAAVAETEQTETVLHRTGATMLSDDELSAIEARAKDKYYPPVGLIERDIPALLAHVRELRAAMADALDCIRESDFQLAERILVNALK